MALTTVKSSGGDYASWSLHEASENGDHVTATDIATAECYGFTDTTAVTIAGGTSNSTYYYQAVAASGAEAQMPADEAGTAYNLDPGTTGAQVLISDDYVRMSNIQVKLSTTSATTTVCVWLDGATDPTGCIIDSCHAYGDSQSVAANFYGFISIAAGSNYFVNCFSGDLNSATGTRQGVGFYTNGGAGCDTWFYNCTAYGDLELGFEERHPSDTTIFKNDISLEARGNDFTASGTGSGHDNNSSNDATAPGTNASTGVTTSIYVGSGDYHLSGNHAGADLSSDTDFSFDNSFDIGVTRSAWDRGAAEFVSGTVYSRTLTSNIDVQDPQQIMELKYSLLLSSVSVSDSIVRTIIVELYRQIQDALDITDSSSVEEIMFRLLTAQTDITDQQSFQKILQRAILSAFDITDLTNEYRVQNFIFLDGVDISDNYIGQSLDYRLLNDSLSIVDLLLTTSDYVISRTLTSSISDITDSHSEIYSLTRELLSSCIVVDQLLQSNLMVRLLTDNPDILDSVIETTVLAPIDYVRTLTDNVDLIDSIVQELTTIYRGIIEASIGKSQNIVFYSKNINIVFYSKNS